MSQQQPQWLWEAQVNKWYYLCHERNGNLVRVYSDPAANASSSSSPRNIRHQPSHAATPSLLNCQLQDGTPSSYTYQTHSPRESDSIAQQFQSLQLQSSGQAVAGAQYENYQTGRDVHGVQYRTVDGPKRAITDPALRARGIVAHKKLLATAGKQELLDSDFKVQSPSFYETGRVFLILWTEPSSMQPNATDVTRVRFNQTVYTKVRRFVVIRPGELSCSAIPILTYTGQGVGKTGIRKYEHAIMYTGMTAPQPLSIEEPTSGEGMMEPVRVIPDQPGAQLDRMSRAHYGKVYTIEANLKVKPFGKIEDPQMFMAQFMKAWGLGQIGPPARRGSSSGVPGSFGVRNAQERPNAYIPSANLPIAAPRVQAAGTALGSGGYGATPGPPSSIPSGSGLPRSTGYASSPPNAGSAQSPQSASAYNAALFQRQTEAQKARDIELAAARRRAAAEEERATGTGERQTVSPAPATNPSQASEDTQAVSAAAAYGRMVAGGTPPEQALAMLAEQIRRDEKLSPDAANYRASSLVARGHHLFTQRT